MKLSELVRYLNYLDQDTLPASLAETLNQSQKLLSSIVEQPGAFPSYNFDLESDFSKIQDSVAQFLGTVDSVKQQVRDLIAEREFELYSQSQHLYEDEMIYETAEYILNRKLSISDQQIHEIEATVLRRTDWRWPGLIFRPGKENFIESLVPLDPLYIVDQSMDLLQPAISKFEPTYQRRLRPYVIDDREPGNILGKLPDNQFGFVFANAFFNFKPLDLIYRYLDELYNKIRPGGFLLFTYNECDLWQGVDIAERSFMCYTPGHRIRSHAESLGFVVEKNITDPANAAWFEFSKPGELDSIRGGQSLAKIMPKPVAESK